MFGFTYWMTIFFPQLHACIATGGVYVPSDPLALAHCTAVLGAH